MTHGTHGPQWIADEIRKAEKMTDTDTSPNAVEIHWLTYEGDQTPFVFHADYAARVAELGAERDALANWRVMACQERDEREAAEQRVAELEQRNVALGEAVAYAEQRNATLEERYLAIAGDKIDLRGEVATLEVKLAKADAWQEAVFSAHPNIDLDIETKGDSPLS